MKIEEVDNSNLVECTTANEHERIRELCHKQLGVSLNVWFNPEYGALINVVTGKEFPADIDTNRTVISSRKIS